MKRIQKLLSMILALVMVLSMQTGNLTAFAEEIPTEPLTETLPSPVLEDGHFDADLLTQWVDAYLDENYWNHPGCEMTIAYWYSGTDETWFYNADEWIGCVNWYKLPLCMYYAEKLKSGEMTKETVVTGITLEYAMSTLLEHSSGPSLYSLATDLTDREGLSYTDVAKQYADLPESYFTSEYYNNAYTARLMMEITKTLFEGGEDRFPFVLENMKKSQPYDMFKRDWNIQSKWEVAQTHAADWGGEGDDLIHCTGIFYTPTPAILTIMTKNIWESSRACRRCGGRRSRDFDGCTDIPGRTEHGSIGHNCDLRRCGREHAGCAHHARQRGDRRHGREHADRGHHARRRDRSRHQLDRRDTADRRNTDTRRNTAGDHGAAGSRSRTDTRNTAHRSADDGNTAGRSAGSSSRRKLRCEAEFPCLDPPCALHPAGADCHLYHPAYHPQPERAGA